MGIIKRKIQRATKKLGLMENMDKLKKDLQKLGTIPSGKDIYDYGVKFFNIIASFQDENALEIELFKDAKEEAQLFAKHISNAGRNQWGWVRAPRGETVTLHNLYLGNTAGIWTDTAASFKESRDPEVQKIIQCQLYNFMRSHRASIMELVSKILTENKTPNNIIVRNAYAKAKTSKR